MKRFFFFFLTFLKCVKALVVSKYAAVERGDCLGVWSHIGPGFIFVKAGVNKLSKIHLFQSKDHRITSTKFDLNSLKCRLPLCSHYVRSGVLVMLGECTNYK